MARIKAKVYEWTPKKGKSKCLMDIYYATEENKNTLFDIYTTHKMWGEKWYDLVRVGAYESAKIALIAEKKAQGFFFMVAINCIDDLAYLMAEMKRLDAELEANKK